MIFFHLSKRQIDTDQERSSIRWFTASNHHHRQMPASSRAGPDQSREPGTQVQVSHVGDSATSVFCFPRCRLAGLWNQKQSRPSNPDTWIGMWATQVLLTCTKCYRGLIFSNLTHRNNHLNLEKLLELNKRFLYEYLALLALKARQLLLG